MRLDSATQGALHTHFRVAILLPSNMNRDLTAVPSRTGQQLHGWKEIASYFGRSVRTVQRWERDFGLPVRRFGMGRAEVVHAYVEELDRWRATAEAEAATDASESNGNGALARGDGGTNGRGFPGGGAKSDTNRAIAPWRRLQPPTRAALAIGGLLTLAAVVAVGVAFARRAPGGMSGNGAPSGSAGKASTQPAGWNWRGDTMTVLSADGRPLWTHGFPFGLDAPAGPLPGKHPDYPVRIEDIDGDGLEEVLVRTIPSNRERGDFRFYAFSHDGTLRWSYVHGGAQTFGGSEYAPPFLAHRIITTPRADGGKNVWLVSVHSPWFPSVMSQTRPDGTPSAEYWSNGHISRIWEGVIAGRRVVLVGARSNEAEGASVAMLDADHPAGSAPADEARYRCSTCPPGQPLRFVKIPKPDRLKVLRGTSPVMRISVDGPSHIIVWVNHVLDWEPNLGEVIYTFDADLRLLSAVPSDSYAAACRSLQAKQLIAPPAASSPSGDQFPVRWWDGAGFVELIAPTQASRPGGSR